jgi:hypothetical protein
LYPFNHSLYDADSPWSVHMKLIAHGKIDKARTNGKQSLPTANDSSQQVWTNMPVWASVPILILQNYLLRKLVPHCHTSRTRRQGCQGSFVPTCQAGYVWPKARAMSGQNVKIASTC